MPTVRILRYRAFKGSSIVHYTTATDLVEKLVEKSRRKVEDGVEGYMARFCVKVYERAGYLLNNASPEVFVQGLISIKFIELIE